MSQYVIAIAGQCENGLPTNVAVTFIPDYSWPVFHKAFDSDDLTGLWWYAPASEALPVIDAALEYFDTHQDELKPLVAREDWRGVDGNRQVLARLRQDLATYDDNVIAWGRE